MTRRTTVPLLALLITSLIALAALADRSAAIRGAWTADADADELQLNMVRSRNHVHGESLPVTDFTGLTESEIASVSETPVHFQLVREAGTIAFEGLFKMRQGSGHFSFAPNDNYLALLRSLGVEIDDSKHTDEERLFDAAVFDISTTFIKELQHLGYRLPMSKYEELRIFRVTPALIRDLRDLGFTDLSAEKLVEMQIHGATPQFIRGLRAAGYTSLTEHQLVTFRIHGVSIDFINELRSLGYKDIDPEDLVAMRIHGVTPSYIRDLKSAGYENIPVKKLIEMRIHGVDAEFVKNVK